MRRILLLGLTAALFAACSSQPSTEVVCQRWTIIEVRLANNAHLISMQPQIDDMEDAAANSNSAELMGLVGDLKNAAATMNPASTIPSERFRAAGRAIDAYCTAHSPSD
jgi:hypothetical protein